MAVQERIAWNIANVGRIIAPRVVTGEGPVEERVTCEPVGVVAHVSAWNYPYFVGLNTIVPALLAGNAVCYKPSEHATLSSLLNISDSNRTSGSPEGSGAFPKPRRDKVSTGALAPRCATTQGVRDIA